MGGKRLQLGLPLLVFLAISIPALSAMFVLRPPAPSPVDAPPDRFSARRAFAPSLSLFSTGLSRYPFAGMVGTSMAAGCVIAILVPALSLLDTRGARVLSLLAAVATLVLIALAHFT